MSAQKLWLKIWSAGHQKANIISMATTNPQTVPEAHPVSHKKGLGIPMCHVGDRGGYSKGIAWCADVVECRLQRLHKLSYYQKSRDRATVKCAVTASTPTLQGWQLAPSHGHPASAGVSRRGCWTTSHSV